MSDPQRQQGRQIVSATGIEKRFGALDVLRGIDLCAHEHDVVTLIGASGSGKSTFLRCLNLLEVPDAGTIAIDGEEIRMRRSPAGQASPASKSQVNRLRAGIGMVFQNFNLWSHMTVLENVAMPPMKVLGLSRREATERAEALLAKVGLGDRLRHYPAHISGGQQQRCAIARALAMEPKLLLFDEPTSALDPELVGEVLKVIRLLAEEGRTMVMVTHEMAFAREVSTEVAFLHKGKIEERGAPADVFGNPRSERCRKFLDSVL
ncbi:MAG: ATP-binding cassette domain-containing protein [Pseudomonadota bacterium]|uniref:ABC transporter ATP-binding protein n=1 Tax=Variovorax boronicumulans TaxID=436515 RepID=UPI00278B96EC|nr:ABC-type histidine transport system ATPase subunit [Variovorax boronicumulans]